VTRGIRPGVRRLFQLSPRTDVQASADADGELDAFLEERIEQLVRRGMTPGAARAEALARLGAPLHEARAGLRDSARRREARRHVGTVIDELRDDIRFAWRQCMKAPGFTAIAVLTLALGIGANTAIFSVVHRLVLAPLPYPEGDRIVMPMQVAAGESDVALNASAGTPQVAAWLARGHTVAEVAGASEFMFSLRADGTVDTIPSGAVTANFLHVLGVRPILGHGFVHGDELPDGAASVAMISHSLWQRSYGGRADVLGKTVSLDGRPRTIVGVTPAGLSIPLWRTAPPEIWVPAPLEDAGGGGSGTLEPGPTVFAWLRPSATPEAASSELQAIASSAPERPGVLPTAENQAPQRFRVMRARDFLGQRERRALQVLFTAVGALLLIACANVANLLLARAWARQHEFAIRGALGASRARLARQVLTESMMLALAGGVLGVGVAWLSLRIIIALRPPALASLADVRLQPVVLLWTLGVAVATGMLFGCVPALLSSAETAGDALRRETRGGSSGTLSRRVRSALIVFEIAASLVLLSGAGLLVRSFAALQGMRLGFEPRGLVYTDVLLGSPQFRDRRLQFRAAIIDRLRAVPGVTGVAFGVMPGKGYGGVGLETEKDPSGQQRRVPSLGTVFISPDYFRVARIALLRGRLPDSSVAPAQGAMPPGFSLSPEVLVNQEVARRLWPDGRALGARVREPAYGRRPRAPEPWSTVVGVVDDTRMPDVRGDRAEMQVYSLVPARLGDVPVVVRTNLPGDVAVPMIKRAIASVHPAIFVRPPLSGDTYLRDGLAPTRFAMALITAFAILALVLAAVGLYGVVAYGVTQRTREIGVRVALGAEPKAVIELVVGVGLRLAVVGVGLGLGIAITTSRVLGSMLYAIRPADPVTLGATALIVIAVALLASYVPARRALRIDPAEALRGD
jgi:putative ABC transport system permease protein